MPTWPASAHAMPGALEQNPALHVAVGSVDTLMAVSNGVVSAQELEQRIASLKAKMEARP